MHVQLGLSRSGSTVTWQIMGDLLGDNVAKSHSYDRSDSRPTVITVRHPFDAAYSYYLSTRKKGDNSRPGMGAFGPIISSARAVMDCMDYGNVQCIVTYECWFPNTESLVRILSRALRVPVTDEKIYEIVHRRSIVANKAIADAMVKWENYDRETMIHGQHINGGGVGKWAGVFSPQVVEEAKAALGPFLERFGYRV